MHKANRSSRSICVPLGSARAAGSPRSFLSLTEPLPFYIYIRNVLNFYKYPTNLLRLLQLEINLSLSHLNKAEPDNQPLPFSMGCTVLPASRTPSAMLSKRSGHDAFWLPTSCHLLLGLSVHALYSVFCLVASCRAIQLETHPCARALLPPMGRDWAVQSRPNMRPRG